MEEEKAFLTHQLNESSKIQWNNYNEDGSYEMKEMLPEEKKQSNLLLHKDGESNDFDMLCSCGISLKLFTAQDIINNTKDEKQNTNPEESVINMVSKYAPDSIKELNKSRKSIDVDQTQFM
eukprot:181737_1